MTVDGGLNLAVHGELADSVVSRFPGMMEAVTAVGSVISTVPVIEIEIMKHGGGNQRPSVGTKPELFVQPIAGFRHTPAVLER